MRTKTTDESWNTAGEEEKEQEAAAGASSKEPGGATKVEAYGGGEELVGTSEKHGELTSTALKVHDREGSPQPKRQRSGGFSGKYTRQQREEVPTYEHCSYVWEPQRWEDEFQLPRTGGARGERQDEGKAELR